MSPPIETTTITLENGRKARTAFPRANSSVEEVATALKLPSYKVVLLIIGGIDNANEKDISRLTQLFSRGIAYAAAGLNTLIINGSAQAGITTMIGRGVADRGFKSNLIGVAPRGLIRDPADGGAGTTQLDCNHSHFVLVKGKNLGDETAMTCKLMDWFGTPYHTVVLLVGGGDVSRQEALHAVRRNLSLVVVEGTGGVADEIATAWSARSKLPDDPQMAEIIMDGKLQFCPISHPVKDVEQLLNRILSGDNVLAQTWQTFADYDLNAIKQKERFGGMQISILAIGVLATALALAKQVCAPKDADGVDSAEPLTWWWFVAHLLIIMPIALAVLMNVANRFRQGNKWILLRTGAESIKREIYRYRARVGDYQRPSADALPDQLNPNASGPPTPEDVLAQRTEDITRRIMRTEVNSSSITQYSQKLPPAKAKASTDDGFSVLSPDRYINVRLDDQLKYYKKAIGRHDRLLKAMHWLIFIIGGIGTYLAAINHPVWIALTTTVAAALTAFLGYRQVENTLMKYNQAASDLESVKSWWAALASDEQEQPENIAKLVDHTETILQSEHDGWVQQMQNALAELRKDTERSPKE